MILLYYFFRCILDPWPSILVFRKLGNWASVFCFDNPSPEKSCFIGDLVCFILLSLRVFLFLNATRTERNRKEFFFSSFPIALRGELTKERSLTQFTIIKGTVKVCLLLFRLEDLRKCVTDQTLTPNHYHLAQCFHWFQWQGQLKFIRLVIPL